MLSVFTAKEYRGKGICTQLIKNLIQYGKEHNLGRIDLSATEKGYPVYKKLGFQDKQNHYTDMHLEFK